MNEQTTSTAPQAEPRLPDRGQANLLQLMIHSLYSDREIFLRELISNASDARGQAALRGARRLPTLERRRTCRSTSSFDPEARTLTVRDNGIGMSREEVIATSARSPSRHARVLREAVRATQAATRS